MKLVQQKIGVRLSVLLILVSSMVSAQEQVELPSLGDALTEEQVNAFANLALKGLDTEFPNKPGHVFDGAESVAPPKELTPAFYGSFDWHSSVHGHWMLIRLLRQFPGTGLDSDIRKKLHEHLSAENIKTEAEFFSQKRNKSFERMYGWAWYLRMVIECESWDDTDAKVWRENLKPLEEILVSRAMDYLPLLQYPIRTGQHPDSGFALGQLLDYARTVGNQELETLVVQRAKDFFADDTDYPTRYEPSGHDFFSSCWNEADLMRRVLPQAEFVEWFDRYLPELKQGKSGNLLIPVEVTDVTDGKLVHLAGLDLSRGWCLQGIVSSLPEDDPRIEMLQKAAADHAQMGYKYVFSGHYEGEHWLATFAIYLHTQVGVDK